MEKYSVDSSDVIDPRSYYAIRGFLDEVYNTSINSNQIPDLILPTTWLLNIDAETYPYIAMPFNVNNVDLSVNANIIFGLTHFLFSVN